MSFVMIPEETLIKGQNGSLRPTINHVFIGCLIFRYQENISKCFNISLILIYKISYLNLYSIFTF